MILLQVPTTGGSAVDSTAAAAPAQSMQLFDLVAKGGWVMIPISILFFLTLYMIIERWLFIRSNTRVDDNFIDNVKDMVMQGNIKSD
jgi:biopolymer transport protein ExbB